MNLHSFRVRLSGVLGLGLILILLAGILSITAADENRPAAPDQEPIRRSNSQSTVDKLEPWSQVETEREQAAKGEGYFDFSGRFTGSGWKAPVPSEVGDTCQQLLGNTKFMVTDGSMAPWVILDQIVYYSTKDYTSAPHSVLMEAEDEGLSADVDAFGQAVEIPVGELTKVTIDYKTASVNSNELDIQGAAIWTVDAEGYLDEYVMDWAIGDSDGKWVGRKYKITDGQVLKEMEGKMIALIFFFETNDTGKAEIVLYDDAKLTACTEPQSVPDRPSNLTADAVSSMQIVLDWSDNSDNEDGFKIEHSLSGTSGWTQIATTAASSHAPPGLACDTTHYFRVRAYNSSGDSGYSNIASDKTFACAPPPSTDPPDPPSNLTADAISQQQIILHWSDNSNNEDGFKIEHSLSGSSGWIQIATTAATSHAPPGLECGTTHYFRVRAYNSFGNSLYSNTASDTTHACPHSSLEPMAYLPYVVNRHGPAATPRPTVEPTSSPPTATPTNTRPPSSDINGNWTGTTTQGRPLAFKIQNRRIASVAFSIQLPGCTRSGQITFSGGSIISGNTFEKSWGGILPGEDKMTLEGRFTSDNAASGTLSNEGSNCGDGTVSWTATK